jgi:hypothetical protein
LLAELSALIGPDATAAVQQFFKEARDFERSYAMAPWCSSAAAQQVPHRDAQQPGGSQLGGDSGHAADQNEQNGQARAGQLHGGMPPDQDAGGQLGVAGARASDQDAKPDSSDGGGRSRPPKPISLSVSGDKLARTAVHQFFKRLGLPKTSTETVTEESGQTSIQLFYHAQVRVMAIFAHSFCWPYYVWRISQMLQ